MSKLSDKLGTLCNNRFYYLLNGVTDCDEGQNTQELERRAFSCINDIRNNLATIDSSDFPLIVLSKDGTPLDAGQLLLFYLYKLPEEGVDCKKVESFCEKMRKLVSWPWIGDEFRKWEKHCFRDTYFDCIDNSDDYESNWVYAPKPGITLKDVPDWVIQFSAYIAICHIKYGASYDSVSANEIFRRLNNIGSSIVEDMKKNGSGDLPKEIAQRKGEGYSCVANDAFATIKISIKEESEENYKEVLDFLCKLLEFGFPKSYSIEFRSKDKNYIPAKGIQKKGTNQLFTNAVRYPKLYPLMEKYARLAMCRFEWYNNFEAENCCMPGTFAVYALALQNESYLPLLNDYFDICDDEHSSLQDKFLPALVEKWGISDKTIASFIKGACALQELSPNKIYQMAFQPENALKILLEAKKHLGEYIPDLSETPKDEQPDLLCFIWKNICHGIWGKKADNNGKQIIKEAPTKMQSLYIQLFENNF